MEKNIIKGSKTVEHLIEYIENEYNINIIDVLSNGITIFKNLISANNGNKNMKIEDIYFKVKNQEGIKNNKNFLSLKINGEYEHIHIIIPLFKYISNDND